MGEVINKEQGVFPEEDNRTKVLRWREDASSRGKKPEAVSFGK
ncbi:MAG: hypothetical protein ACFFB3_09600 [Candidatus Hodarchaeota archaeon]